MPDPILTIDHLNHAYGERVALRDINLSVNTGEIFGFLGPNGSGKTTLFRVLSTLIPPMEGRVTMMGMDLATQRDEIRKQIGVVFQSPGLDKQLTARENLMHQGHLYGMRGKALADRIEMLLERVGLADRSRIKERVSTFSGGMRRRVELAKGLLHRPRLILLDEPSTGLDPGARIDLWKYLRDIREQDNVTILLTTHLMEEADGCDRLTIMDGGRVVASDRPLALKEKVGGDVFTLTGPNVSELPNIIRTKLGIESTLLNGSVRFEHARGHELTPTLVESLSGMIDSISVGKATLEDVFIHLTGRGLRNEEESAVAGEKSGKR